MSTLEEKAEEVVGKIVNNNLEDYDELVEIVRMALKEQDRDTRHACAEAVNAVDIPSTLPGWGLVVDGMKAHFHAAVMNCRGGLEKDNA